MRVLGEMSRTGVSNYWGLLCRLELRNVSPIEHGKSKMVYKSAIWDNRVTTINANIGRMNWYSFINIYKRTGIIPVHGRIEHFKVKLNLEPTWKV